MLFDLRGRGRRRTIQAIYLSLAILMGGGLVFFGIGGNTSGGLFDAFQGSAGTVDAEEAFQKRLDTLEQRTRVNPRNSAAWAQLAGVRFQLATTGTNYDQSSQTYTQSGKAQLRRAAAAWQRHIALSPERPDERVANQMVQAYGFAGLRQYDKAVQALEYVIDARDPTPQLYAQLAILAHAAKQERKATLSAEKAVELAPRDERKELREQIKQAQSQLDGAAGAGQPEPQ